MESDPPQYGLKVVSGLPHSGVRFLLLDWERAGDRIDVTVLNGELLGEDRSFAQVYDTVENYVNLGADFEPSKIYTVLVNDVTQAFVAQ